MRDYNGADVIHFTNVYVPPRNPRTAFVVTIHDIDAIIDPTGYSRRYRAYFFRAVTLALKRADLVVTVSAHARTTIMERFPAREGLVKTLGQGLSQEFIHAAQVVTAPTVPSEPYVLFVGSLSMKKNIPWLVRAFTKGVTSGALPRVRLILAGRPGHGFGNVVRELDRAGSHVAWQKAPSTADLVSLYRGASLVILPSRTEGFGLPLLEAMFLNKPIVASDIPTSREIAAGSGHFFELDSEESFFHAVNEAYADRDQERRSQAARTNVKRYLWTNLVPAYLDAYREARSRL